MNKNNLIFIFTFIFFINSTRCNFIDNVYEEITEHISKKPIHTVALLYSLYCIKEMGFQKYFLDNPMTLTRIIWNAGLLDKFDKNEGDLSYFTLLFMPDFPNDTQTKTVEQKNEPSVLHLKEINEQLNEFKQRLIKYYELGEYNNQVQEICKHGLSDIFSLEKPNNAAVIFDIDETVLTDYYFFKEKNFEWTIQEAFEFRQKGISQPIKPILEFYKELIKKDYKIIFLTSRRDSLYDVTVKNLNDYGFGEYSELILLPMDLFEAGVKHHEWKAQVRQELSERYNIVASISDSQKDFEGDNTGYCIKLPNYLY